MSANNPVIGPRTETATWSAVCQKQTQTSRSVRYRAKPCQRKPALSCFSLGRTQYKD